MLALLQGVAVCALLCVVTWVLVQVFHPRQDAEAEYWRRKVRNFNRERD
jgi:hypothetical protein